jgi:hypothetical protein
MNTKRFFAAMGCLLLAGLACAQGWHDAEGRPLPDTPSRRSVSGFGGWLITTADPDWAKQLEAGAQSVPHFKEVKSLKRGVTAYTLIVFSNAKETRQSAVKLACDIKVTRPDGSESFSEQNVECFDGKLRGPRGALSLAVPVISFLGEPDDPAGLWWVDVVLRDTVGKVELKLRSSFTLE